MTDESLLTLPVAGFIGRLSFATRPTAWSPGTLDCHP